MKRISESLAALVFVLFFASGILCASMAAPELSLASVAGCSQSSHKMEMAGCDHPYLCGFDSSSVSRGVLSSLRSNELSKSAADLAIGEALFDTTKEVVPFGIYPEDVFLIHGLHKISIRLFNSILNL